MTNLGVHEDVSPKILAPAKERAIEFLTAADEDKAMPFQLFKAELEIGQVWAREAIGAASLSKSIEEFQVDINQMGYGVDSEIGKSLLNLEEEIKKDRPNRPLVAQLFSQVADVE